MHVFDIQSVNSEKGFVYFISRNDGILALTTFLPEIMFNWKAVHLHQIYIGQKLDSYLKL